MGLFETGRATNSIIYTGKLYDFDITIRQAKDASKGYMAFGTLQFAISDNGETIVPLKFFTNSLTKAGAPNKLFTQLFDILKGAAVIANRQEKDTVFEIKKKIEVDKLAQEISASLSLKPRMSGIENVPVMRAGGGFSSNMFLNAQNEEVVSVERQLGFLSLSNSTELGSSFEADAYLVSATPRLDKDGAETGEVNLKALLFDFRDAVIPVNFRTVDEGAYDYFSGLLEDEETRMVKLNGFELSQVLVQESAPAPVTHGWGQQPTVRQIKTYDKAFIAKGASVCSKPWSEEELKKSMAQYNIDKEQKFADLRARKAAPQKAPVAAAPVAQAPISPASAVETVNTEAGVFDFF